MSSLADTNQVSLSVSPGSTLVQGATFKFTATPLTPSVTWRYKYLYYAYDKATATFTWTTLSNWSISPIFNWTPTTAQAGNNIQVAVHMIDYLDLMSDQTLYKDWSAITTISVRPRLSKVNLSITPGTSAALGSAVNLSASTVNGNVITGAIVKYRFRYSTGNGWSTIQDYSLNSTAIWQPDTTGTYFVEVCAKEYSTIPVPTTDYDVRYQVIYKITPGATTVTTSINPSTILLSNAVTISSVSDIGNNAEYSYLYSADNGTTWNPIQNYSSLSIATWVPTGSGDFLIKSRVRSKGNLSAYEAESQPVSLHVNPKPLSGVNVTANPANSVILGNQVTFTGVSQGGIIPNYRISIKAADGTILPISNAYQVNGNFVWTPDTKGNYAVTIDCKETGSVNDYDYRKTINYQVLETQTNLQIGNLIATPVSPFQFTNGMVVTLTASILNGINPEYKFTYTDLTGEYIIRDYSVTPTMIWTPAKLGNYSLKVYVRSFGDVVTTPLTKSIQYSLYDATTAPDINDLSIAITENPPYTINNPINISALATGGRSVEYKFTYRSQSNAFATESSLKSYDLINTVKFTPTKDDNYRLYAFAREQGSDALFRVFAYKDITVLKNSNKPSNVKAVQVASGISLTWDQITDCYKLTVRRRVYGGRDWNVIKPDPTIPTDTYLINTDTSYIDNIVPIIGTTYEYQVGNINQLSGNIAWSDSVYFMEGLSWGAVSNSAISFAAQVPAIPKLVSAQDTINVTWTSYPGVDGYILQYSLDGVTWIDLDTNIAANINTYAHVYTNPDATLTNLPKLTYRVQAFKNLIDSTGVSTKTYSNWLVKYDQATIDFTWSDVGSIDGFNLQYSSDGATWIDLVTDVDKSKRSYAYTTTLIQSAAITYRVVAFKLSVDANGITIKSYKQPRYTTAVNNNYIYKYEAPYPVVPSFSTIVTTGATIKLNWSASIYSQFFKITRSQDNGTTWTSIGNSVGQCTGQSLTDGVTTPLSNYPTMYQYRICACNEYHQTDWSALSSGSYIAPVKPTWVSATSTNSGIDLMWNCPTGYTFEIFRADRPANNPFTSTVTNYSDSTATNRTYTYTIRALTPLQGLPATLPQIPVYSDISDPITVTTGTFNFNLNLTIGAIGTNNLNLSWSPYPDILAPDATASYEVEKWSAASPTWTNVKTAANITAFQDTTFPYTTNNTNPYTNIYMYRVRVKPTVPPAPAGSTSNWEMVRIYNVNLDNTKITAIDNKDKTVTLTWPSVASAKGYRIKRTGGPSGTVFMNTAVTYSTLTTYVDNNSLDWGYTYDYFIQPTGDSGDTSTFDNNYDIRIILIPDKPVINSITVDVNDHARINLTLPFGTDRYNVERLIGATWQQVNQTVQTATALVPTNYTDDTVPPMSNTQYRIRAYLLANATNLSPYSDSVSFINLASHPTTFTATVASDTSINLAFSFPANYAAWFAINPYPDPSSYDIVYCTGAVANWAAPAGTINIAGNLKTYTHASLTPETTYWYRIYAYNNAPVPVRSTAFAASNPTSVVTLPTAPVLTLGSVDCHNVNMSWAFTPINAATSFTLEADKYDGAGWVAMTAPPALTSPYVDANLLPGTKRNYRVKAIRTGANSYTTLYSNTIIAQTRDLPAAPTLILSTIDDTSIQLKWSKIFVSTTPAQTECIYKYKIKKVTDNTYSVWTDINAPTDIGNNQYTYNITGLLPNTKYQVYIQAVDIDGNTSADSVINSTTTLTGNSALSVVSTSSNSITVNWTAITGAKSYTINVNPGIDINNINAALTQYEITALADNSSFDIKIKTISDAGSSAWSSILTAYTKPIPPTLTVTKVNNSNVLLNWNESYNPIITYNIERLAVDGTVKQITALTSGITDNVTGAGVSYKYRINVQTAVDTSLWSSYIVYSLNPDVPMLTFKALSQTSIQISWNTIANADSYELERKSGTNWIKISSFSPAIDMNLSPGTTYTYRIQSIGKNGAASDWTTGDGSTKTAVPSGLTATATNDGKISLSWNDVNGETGYNIQRSIDGITWSSLAGTAINITTLIDSSILTGTKYYYRVASFNISSTSDYSAAVSVNSISDSPVLIAQSASANSIYLIWTNVTGETGYELQKLNGLNWVTLKTTAVDVTLYSDVNVTSGTSYSYRVRSLVNSITSAWSDIKSVTTKPNVPVITIVTNFDKSVTLTWSDVSGETGYRIEKNVNNVGWVLLTETDALTFTLNDPNPNNDFISYRVASFNAGGYSTWSNTVTTSTVPVAPTLTGVPSSNILITLSWQAIPNSNYYEIQKMVGSIWMIHGTTKSTQTYASGLKGSTTYKFRIRAYNNIGVSAWSNELSVLTKPNAPILTGKVKGLTTNTLTWGIIPGATGYNVYRDNVLLTNVMLSPATVTYTDKVASYSTSIYYVIAVNDSGNSSQSNKITLTTK